MAEMKGSASNSRECIKCLELDDHLILKDKAIRKLECNSIMYEKRINNANKTINSLKGISALLMICLLALFVLVM